MQYEKLYAPDKLTCNLKVVSTLHDSGLTTWDKGLTMLCFVAISIKVRNMQYMTFSAWDTEQYLVTFVHVQYCMAHTNNYSET